MFKLRKPDEIFQTDGEIENGTFHGHWHFSFDMYYDPAFVQFGMLRVFDDDTLSPGATWPLHPHREIEVVTYCATGEFQPADKHGVGGVLQKGWVQHTTVGKGMYHAEINNHADESMRFIQMWFLSNERRLEPAVEQKCVERVDRSNRFLSLVSNEHGGALLIHSEAEVYSSSLEAKHAIKFMILENWGLYLYLLEGGPVQVNRRRLETL